MKNWIVNIGIAIVCFALGYAYYPTINDVKLNVHSTPAATDNERDKPAQDLNDRQETSATTVTAGTRKIINDTNSIASEESEGVDDVAVIDHVNRSVSGSSNVKSEPNDVDELAASVQQELEQWSADHRAQIDQLVDENMSGESAEHMKAQISNGNDFLSKPPVMQDSYEDEHWAYNMEQQLSLLIAQHELSNGFKLLNLSCKQLMCDIFGIENESNTWIKLYFNLLQNAPNAEFPDANSGLKSIQYMQNGASIIYSQIRFKSN